MLDKIVLVVRKTRLVAGLADLQTGLEPHRADRLLDKVLISRKRLERFSQDRHRSGGDFADYEREDATYRRAVETVRRSLDVGLKLHVVERSLVPTMLFAEGDVVVAVGQDGLVANTAKYVGEQPIVAVNPDPARFDGILLRYSPAEARAGASS